MYPLLRYYRPIILLYITVHYVRHLRYRYHYPLPEFIYYPLQRFYRRTREAVAYR